MRNENQDIFKREKFEVIMPFQGNHIFNERRYAVNHFIEDGVKVFVLREKTNVDNNRENKQVRQIGQATEETTDLE
ncbi:MAG: hypothetical protein PHT54_03460 [Candidatus Nanoarchaeia archaeon]|nr:hypothetical protein [Candidatus Nanoarchaeia archaeon]